ncbi:MAG: metallophosphoesterase [Candidatus Helarchaeota archaeon]
MAKSRTKLKKELLRLGIFIGILVTFFTIPLLPNQLGPWLLVPFQKGPYLTWSADPSTTMTISYETPFNISTTLYYGKNASMVNVKGTTNQQIHTITLTGLEPNTLYYYEIVSSDFTCYYMNKIFTFKTGLNQTHPAAFRFAVYGDNRPGRWEQSQHQAVVNRILTNDVDFVINTGDIVVEPADLVNWDRLFYELRDLASRKPYMISVGNHELMEGTTPDYGRYYRALFTYPDEEMYYAFNYSNVCFLSLNISVDEHRITTTERAWLINELAQANASTDIDWIIVYFHIPMYSNGGHGINQHIIDDYAEIFRTYKVDIVLAGHDHHYERMYIDDTYFFVTGGGGAPLDFYMSWDLSRAWSQYKVLFFHYMLFDVDGKNLYMQAIRPDGFVFDELHLVSTRN